MKDYLGFESPRPMMDYSGLGGAVRPWNIADKPLEKAWTMDPQDRVDRCLGCTVPVEKCSGGCVRKQPTKGNLDRDAARRLWAQGYTTAEIARRLGVGWSTVRHWQKKEGRKPNPDTWGKLGRAAR